jgi:hypothetical protein
MVFCGPGMPAGRRTLATADLVDFAPTVLSLLGVSAEGVDGRALVDHDGRPSSEVVLRAPGHSEDADLTEAETNARPDNDAPHDPAEARSSHPVAREKRSLPAARVTSRPADIRPARKAELRAGLPTYVAATLTRDRRHAAGGSAEPTSHPSRRLSVGDTRWARLDQARVLAAPGTRLWIAGAGPSESGQPGWRRELGRDRKIDLAEHGPVALGSPDSRGTILVPRDLLVVPVEIRLPELPRWIHALTATLRRHNRFGLDLSEEAGPVLLNADDFVSIVDGLARQLDPTPDPTPEPPIFEAVHVAATYPGVIEATDRLRELLPAHTVTRFTLAGGGVLA